MLGVLLSIAKDRDTFWLTLGVSLTVLVMGLLLAIII